MPTKREEEIRYRPHYHKEEETRSRIGACWVHKKGALKRILDTGEKKRATSNKISTGHVMIVKITKFFRKGRARLQRQFQYDIDHQQ